jgi:transcriptional regulator with XRE-family HTH domain
MISPAQSRAARGLIDLSQTKLAEAAGISLSTVRDFETGKRTPTANNLAAIKRALEEQGVIFIDTNGEGSGVRLTKKAEARARQDKPDEGKRPEQLTSENDG